MVQLAPVPRTDVQLSVSWKSPETLIEGLETQPWVAAKVTVCGLLDAPSVTLPKSSAAGDRVAAGAPVSTNSYAPISTVLVQVVALPKATRGLPSRSVWERFGADLLPASIAGELARRWKSLAAALTNCGSAEMLPEVPFAPAHCPPNPGAVTSNASLKEMMGW